MEKLADLLRRCLNALFYRFVGGDRRPVCFDVRETYPELEAIDANYAAIRAELMAILHLSAAIPRYHEVDKAQTGISGGDESSWRAFFVHRQTGAVRHRVARRRGETSRVSFCGADST